MTNSHTPKKKSGFLLRQRNTIIAFAIIFAVLLAGYLIVKNALEEDAPTTTEETTSVELLPGEATFGTTTLLYPYIQRENLKEVRVHNPANASRGEEYIDWSISFAYDETEEDYYGYMTDYPYNVLDDTQFTYFVAAVCNPVFTSRIEDHCSDFSLYGLAAESDADAIYVEVELQDSTVYKLYFGKKNPNGTSYYIRSGDIAKDADGNDYVRDSVYLMNSTTASYFESTLLTLPTAMLNTLISYPYSNSDVISRFDLLATDESILVSLAYMGEIDTPDKLFGGSCGFYSRTPAGYFSSPSFEARLDRLKEFTGSEVMEYATKRIDDVDEDGNEIYYHVFENEVLAEYGLDADHIQYIMRYWVVYQGTDEALVSEVYFSGLRPDGYYYAYAINFNTIVKVDPSTVDFLAWETLDFLDSYALRMSIGYCKELTVKGKIDGEVYEETFVAELDQEYVAKSAYAKNADKEVNMDYYRILFTELYTTVLWDDVPDTLDMEALLATEPYLEISVTTPKVGINAEKFVTAELPSVTRILRFYRYSNGRALMTVEMIRDGVSSGESGSFYVRVSRLDKLITDTKKLCDGLPISNYDKE